MLPLLLLLLLLRLLLLLPLLALLCQKSLLLLLESLLLLLLLLSLLPLLLLALFRHLASQRLHLLPLTRPFLPHAPQLLLLASRRRVNRLFRPPLDGSVNLALH